MSLEGSALLRTLLIAFGILASLMLLEAYVIERDQSRLCGESGMEQGSLEFLLRAQHPTEGFIHSKVTLVISGSPQPPPATTLRILPRNKAPSISEMTFHKWGDGFKNWEDIAHAIRTFGSHRTFPFDSQAFDFEVSTEPFVGFTAILLRNSLAGFVMDCSEITIRRPETEHILVSGILRRSPFTQRSAILLGVASLAFALLVGTIRSLDGLPQAAAAYFLSVWSIRGILSPAILSFPTLLDYWLLGVSCMVLFAVAWRLTERGVQ